MIKNLGIRPPQERNSLIHPLKKTMNDLTSTAKKIMEVFRYFRLRSGEYLSGKLMLSRQYLWQDIEEEEFNQAVEELVALGYIEKMEMLGAWRLLEQGAEYLKGLERH